MHPVLLEIPLFGGFTIYTYGALAALGFLAGIIWISYETRRLNLSSAIALDLAFYIIVSAIIGSRILFLILTDPSRLVRQPWSIFMVWEGGLVFFGGLIAAIIASIIFIRYKKIDFWAYSDVFAPAIALGHAFGRLGCLMAGCCYGRPVDDKWFGLIFPDDPRTFAPSGISLYPTQIIDGLGEILIFIGLVVLSRRKKFDGQLFALYLMGYSVLRFINEFLRGDMDRGYIIPDVLSSGQGISIALFLAGLAIIGLRGFKRGGAK